MRLSVLPLILLSSAAAAQDDHPPFCITHDAFTKEMAARGAILTMANVMQDGSDRRLEAYYQPDQCVWTLSIVQRSNGQITPDSQTCLLGEGDPGVCVPKK